MSLRSHSGRISSRCPLAIRIAGLRQLAQVVFFLFFATVLNAAVKYTYSAPSLFGESATQLTYTASAFVTADTTVNLPDPSVVVTTPTSGSTVTQIQLTSATSTGAQFVVVYSDGTSINSNFGVDFDHTGSFPNGSGVRLTIALEPAISLSFAPSAIALNGSSALGFSISNPTPLTMTGVAFTDSLPAGLVVATPNGLTGSCGGGTITATAGSSSVSLSGATFSSGATCNFSVNVTGTTAGVQSNSVSVSSTSSGTGGTGSASITVVGPPSITKGFGATTIPLNVSTGLTFTIANGNTAASLSGVAFTDSLPAGLAVATPNGLTGSCGGGTITASAGSSSVSLSGATIEASSSCMFSVNVTGIAAGQQNNSVTVSSSNGGAGNVSNATIQVLGPPAISSLNPSSATAGSAAFTLTVNGTNYISGSTVQFNGNSLTTTFVNSAQLTASVPAPLVATAGNFNVIVANPGGTTRPHLNFRFSRRRFRV